MFSQLFLVLVLFVATDSPLEIPPEIGAAHKDDYSQELNRLRGRWQVTSVDVGKRVRDWEEYEIFIDIKGPTFRFHSKMFTEPAADTEGTFTINPFKKLKEFRLTITRIGKADGRTSIYLGLYDLDGDTLRICTHRGYMFPKEFATKEKTLTEIMTFKRIK